jgi:hypothetical protein
MSSNRKTKKSNSKIASDLLNKIKSTNENIDWLKGYQERLILKLFKATYASITEKETIKKDILGINDDISVLKDHVLSLEKKLVLVTEE